MSVVNMKVSYKIQKIYERHKYFLQDTEAGEHIRSFLDIPFPTMDDIASLRGELNNDMQTLALGQGKVWLFLRIDHVLKVAENNYKLQQLGFSSLCSNFHGEYEDGISHGVTVSSALGYANISSAISYGGKNLTAIIGSNELSGITLVNITTNSKDGGITAYLTSLATGITQAVGSASSLFAKTVVINECDADNNIISEIYSASDLAIGHNVNGFVSCHKWIYNHDNSPYFITNSGSSGCTEFNNADAALRECNSYLQSHDEL